jgi:RNA polymerase primary sigma factor
VVLAKSEAKEPTERTDDPVHMYPREMGSVKLLSREGEIAIAKRIEAGRRRWSKLAEWMRPGPS